MGADASRSATVLARLRRIFRQREIYLRGDDRIHYVVVPGWVPAGLAGSALVSLMLVLVGLTGTVTYHHLAEENRAEAIAGRQAYVDLLTDLDALQEQVTRLPTDTGIEGHTAWVALVRRELQRRLDAIATNEHFADPSAAARLEAAGERLALSTTGDETELDGFRARLLDRIARTEAELVAARETRVTLQNRIDDLRHSRASAKAEQLRLAAERATLEGQVVALESSLASYRSAQADLLQAIDEGTRDSIDLVERTVARTGVNLERLLTRARRTSPSAAGGPLVLANAEGSDIAKRMERWEALKRLVRAMPLAAPLDQFSIGSGFGRRPDPFDGRMAMHTGLDFVAPMRASVLSTAGGRVTFAGVRGEYGRMVEIDHGFGIHSRYAHLAEILVRVGDDVPYRGKVGLLGSSGRSTGPHLHYEVLVDGQALNPKKFLEAGRYVFKG
jgi:murein DD-endopeptidase MepM/ murein hydrolase activator NlpD